MCNIFISNFLRISRTRNYYNRYIFDRVIQKEIKRRTFVGTYCISRPFLKLQSVMNITVSIYLLAVKEKTKKNLQMTLFRLDCVSKITR